MLTEEETSVVFVAKTQIEATCLELSRVGRGDKWIVLGQRIQGVKRPRLEQKKG
jgi:hypothetical protein